MSDSIPTISSVKRNFPTGISLCLNLLIERFKETKYVEISIAAQANTRAPIKPINKERSPLIRMIMRAIDKAMKVIKTPKPKERDQNFQTANFIISGVYLTVI